MGQVIKAQAVLLFGLLMPAVLMAQNIAVRDISDREYLPVVLSDIATAQSSIDVSMYSISITSSAQDPAGQLITALVNAAKSGKRVRIWLNSRQAAVGTQRTFLREDIQESLRQAGIELFYLEPSRRLHDKLLVIDRRIVIEGSMNWTREALMRNYESATRIESDELAVKKIERLESFPTIKNNGSQRLISTAAFNFSAGLLTDEKKFPAALEEKEARSLALYLLLLAEADKNKTQTVHLSLKEWSKKLKFKNPKYGWFLANDMKRHLNFLKDRHQLLDWHEEKTDWVRVDLKPQIAGDKIRVPDDLIEGDYLKNLSGKTLFVYLIILRASQKESVLPFWMGNLDEVARGYHTNRLTMIQALTELKRMNWIEIFPGEKKLIEGVWRREYTNRYLINPIFSVEEKAGQIKALQKQFGEEWIVRAQKLADLIDEPEDAEVIREFAGFLKRYPAAEVEKATATVAGFSRNNPLRTTAYIRGILVND